MEGLVGFGGLGIFLFLLIFNKYKGGIKDIYLYLLVWLWLILIVLAAITYITYEKLLDSESHKLEKNLAFSSFCLTRTDIEAFRSPPAVWSAISGKSICSGLQGPRHRSSQKCYQR